MYIVGKQDIDLEHVVVQHRVTLALEKPRTLLEARRHAPQLYS